MGNFNASTAGLHSRKRGLFRTGSDEALTQASTNDEAVGTLDDVGSVGVGRFGTWHIQDL